MVCGRKESLFQQCQLYSKEYTEAVERLKSVSARIALDDWSLAWKIADRARKKSDEILGELKQHKVEHGC